MLRFEEFQKVGIFQKSGNSNFLIPSIIVVDAEQFSRVSIACSLAEETRQKTESSSSCPQHSNQSLLTLVVAAPGLEEAREREIDDDDDDDEEEEAFEDFRAVAAAAVAPIVVDH